MGESDEGRGWIGLEEGTKGWKGVQGWMGNRPRLVTFDGMTGGTEGGGGGMGRI